MSTKRELIYTVFEKLNISSDDTDITEEFVSSLIDSKRAMLIKQRYSTNSWNTPTEIKQELCLNLETVGNIDGMSCFGKILRTKEKLPKTIKLKGKETPINVRRYDRTSIPINIVPIERLPFVGHNSFISQLVYAALDFDNKLYLVSNQKKHHLMEVIKVSDVFENPDDAFEYKCSDDGESCDNWDNEYPLEKSMQDDVINLIVKELASSISIPGDNKNNANDLRDGVGR